MLILKNTYYLILLLLTSVLFINCFRIGKLPKLLIVDYVYVIVCFFFETIFFFNIFQNTDLWACIYDSLFPVAITISVIVKFYYLNKIKSGELWIFLFSYGLIIFALWCFFPKIKFEINYLFCIVSILFLFIKEILVYKISSTLYSFQLPILAMSVYFSGFLYVTDKYYKTFLHSVFLKPFHISHIMILFLNFIFIYAKSRRRPLFH